MPMRLLLSVAIGWLVVSTGWANAAADPAADAAQRLAACTQRGVFEVGVAQVQLDFSAAQFQLGSAPICAWATRAAQAVAGYFGRFPVDRVRIVIKPADGAGVHGGTTYGDGGDGHPLTTIRLGRGATQADLDDDWVMTHEMIHLTIPSVPRASHWFEEGIATYVEPIARAQQGRLDDATVWGDLIRGLPKGQPGAGDRGLDRTPTWGRTYWGGALFCLLADVGIRERTGNRLGLRDALRGVVAAGGNIEKDWPIAKVIEYADSAVGVPVLAELYDAMARAAVPTDLDSLWRRLGVTSADGLTRFDDRAPLAAVRKAITTRDPDRNKP